MAKRMPPGRDGKVHVLSDRCRTCVFHTGNRMSLRPGRLKDLVDSNLKAGAALTCHETLDGEQALCRGFYDAYGDKVQAVQVAQRLGIIQEVEPPEEDFL